MAAIEGLGQKVLVQVCVIVDDADKYARNYCAVFGLEMPESQITQGFSHTQATYYDQPTEAKAKIYSWQLGEVALELLEPLGPPSVWQDWLDAHGPSVHHVAFFVKNAEGVAQSFVEHGFPLAQQGFFSGLFPNGGHTGKYLYMETEKALATTFELLEHYDPNGEPR